ncbi:MAG: hypothetical protein IEMM0008_1670 [bacterium]|nr:MAG: hypothetical protein IEMM0008_1670 [bacterium]
MKNVLEKINMKIVFIVSSIIQIIVGIVMVIAGGVNPGERAFVISGALFFISGNYFLYLLFMRSGKD